ncbi:MAG: M23 family metallopeptidase [Burkholderiales bacterium]|nr:M23 family metallopeptidase [Burkholderiales bacterium]
MTIAEHWAQRAADFHRRHRRGVNGGLVALGVGFSALAFGIAPLAPDAAELPQRTIVEAIALPGLQAQLDALAEHELALTRADLTRATDTAEGLLARLGVVDDEAAGFLRSDPTAAQLLRGRVGKMVQVRARGDGRLLELVARYPADRADRSGTHFTRLTVRRLDGQLQARAEEAELASQVRLASGVIRSSLFAAADSARIPDAISIQMAEIFANEIDFDRDLRRGDTFSIVYEALSADGEPVPWNGGTGRVLAAEFVNAGVAHAAVWFDDGSARGGYFAPDGMSRRRMFLASPMEFSRVSSDFGARMHPIFKTWRQHRGIDYAAPKGTSIRSVGAGQVEFAGWQNGFGNTVEVRHPGGRKTLYAHLSRIDVRRGERIDQGQAIGAVGCTGWCTGPHLHFEFLDQGVHQDPRLIARASEAPTLPAAQRQAFARQAAAYRGQLQIAQSMLGAPAEAE